MDIGHKIKQLRIQKGLTLEELASRSELTKGFLSQTERNLTSPSIATLNDIVEAPNSSRRTRRSASSSANGISLWMNGITAR